MKNNSFQKQPTKLNKSFRTILEKNNKSDLPSKTSAYSVDRLSDKEFEFFIGWLFEELGYEVQSEAHSTHLGVDLVASKDGETIAIQARRYPKTHKVSDSIVLLSQEAKRLWECKKSIVLVTTYFTQKAMADAQSLNIELWDSDTLESKIGESKEKNQPKSAILFSPV